MIDTMFRQRRPRALATTLLALALAGCAVTQPKPPQLDLPTTMWRLPE